MIIAKYEKTAFLLGKLIAKSFFYKIHFLDSCSILVPAWIVKWWTILYSLTKIKINLLC